MSRLGIGAPGGTTIRSSEIISSLRQAEQSPCLKLKVPGTLFLFSEFIVVSNFIRGSSSLLVHSSWSSERMATLNLSTNGPSISKSYQTIVSSPAPSGGAANSPTYGQWAVFSVSTPLVNAFQQGAGGKESVLRVQSTGGKGTVC